MTQETVPFNRRIYGVLQPDGNGMTLLRLSLTPPTYTDPAAVLLLRGILPMGNDITLELVSDPSKDEDLRGPAGADATDAQVAAAVATYLAAHPPAAGKDGTNGTNATDAQVAAAVATWMAAHPLSTVLGTITFGETATIAIQAGVRQLVVDAPGVALGDKIELAPTAALPAGYELGEAIPSAAGKLQVALTVPLIAIGAKYAITARVLRIG